MEHRDSSGQQGRLQKLPLQLSVQVCRRSLTLGALLQWAPGAILAFDQSASAGLMLRVGDKVVGTGQVVKIGSNIGFRVRRMETETAFVE
jgi:flagellar motor switch/type III secretory pathway protein FliN